MPLMSALDSHWGPYCASLQAPAAFFSSALLPVCCMGHCESLLRFYLAFEFPPSQAVAHILPFRDQNRQFLDPIWNQHHVERVEVVLKETVDAKGW